MSQKICLKYKVFNFYAFVYTLDENEQLKKLEKWVKSLALFSNEIGKKIKKTEKNYPLNCFIFNSFPLSRISYN
jgi:hypothetical protein